MSGTIAQHAAACGLSVPNFTAAVVDYGEPPNQPNQTIVDSWVTNFSPEASSRRLNHKVGGCQPNLIPLSG